MGVEEDEHRGVGLTSMMGGQRAIDGYRKRMPGEKASSAGRGAFGTPQSSRGTPPGQGFLSASAFAQMQKSTWLAPTRAQITDKKRKETT